MIVCKGESDQLQINLPAIFIRFQGVSEKSCFSTKKSQGLRKESLGKLFMNCAYL